MVFESIVPVSKEEFERSMQEVAGAFVAPFGEQYVAVSLFFGDEYDVTRKPRQAGL
jgi:hypothetical protein